MSPYIIVYHCISLYDSVLSIVMLSHHHPPIWQTVSSLRRSRRGGTNNVIIIYRHIYTCIKLYCHAIKSSYHHNTIWKTVNSGDPREGDKQYNILFIIMSSFHINTAFIQHLYHMFNVLFQKSSTCPLDEHRLIMKN